MWELSKRTVGGLLDVRGLKIQPLHQEVNILSSIFNSFFSMLIGLIAFLLFKLIFVVLSFTTKGPLCMPSEGAAY